MEYFHLGISVIPRAYLISKNGSQTQAFFFVFHKFFDTVDPSSLKLCIITTKRACCSTRAQNEILEFLKFMKRDISFSMNDF